jgi:acetyl esterase/lipase
MQRISWNQCVGIFAVFVSLGLAPAGATDKPVVVKLWPGKPPGPQALVDGLERDRQKPEDRRIAGRTVMKLGNVAHPEMHVFVPPREKANGAACVVCPGGGFSILAWDLEGTEVAEWLNSFGVAAVVLKYRVPTRQHGWPRIWQGPVMDAQRALSLVRSRAMMWRVDPKRIGILGFSAGGATAALTAVKKGDRLYEPLDEADKQSCAANFAILVYPGGITDPEDKLREEYRVDTNTPPMFFAHAADDRVKCEGSAQLFLALKKAKVPAELHIYRDGGHGYGLRADWPRVTHWPREARGWLHDLGLLTPPRSPADRVRTGNPADHLPPYVRQITWFGERPDWSHDGQRILFVGKPFGDVFEYDLATGRIRPITLHFKHQGFTRALYLANGDILLSGPNEAFDVGDKQAGNRARDLCWLSVLDKDLKKKPVSLGALCAEGPAVSRRRLTLAWTQRWRQKPQLGENRTQLLLADLEYIKGVLRLVKQRVVFDSKQLPFEMGGASLETQNLVPPDDRLLTFSAYQIDAGTNTETFIVDTKTGVPKPDALA